MTLDGLAYTFNGLGDFVLLLASDAQSSFVLQGRTARTGMAQATNFVAFAAQYSSTTTTTVSWSNLGFSLSFSWERPFWQVEHHLRVARKQGASSLLFLPPPTTPTQC